MKRIASLIWLLNLSIAPIFAMDTLYFKGYRFIPTSTTDTFSVSHSKLSLPLRNESNLAELLMNQSFVYVKSYGNGALASAGTRGMGAQHTSVIWNGLNIQSPSNATIDFNLFPRFFIDQASLHTGGSANGTIAGSIILSNQTENISNQVFGECSIGSFSYFNKGIGTSLNLGKLKLKSRGLFSSSKNNYEYYNPFSSIPNHKERIENAEIQQSGFLQDVIYTWNSKHSSTFHFWYLQTARNLPPPIGVTPSYQERQDDFNHRYTFNHTWKPDSNTLLLFNSGYTSDRINYYYTLSALSKSSIVWNEILFSRKIKSSKFSFSMNHSAQSAINNSLGGNVTRNITSVYPSLIQTLIKSKILFSTGLRIQADGSEILPVAGDFTLRLIPAKNSEFIAHVSKIYRLPSFNDLYWNPGGNLNLLPEDGIKYELGFKRVRKTLAFTLNSFYQNVNNWIQWRPLPPRQIWTASNTKEVYSSGIESTIEYKKRIGNSVLIIWTTGGQYASSIIKSASDGLESTLGKQLFYTPKLTGFSRAELHLNKTALFLSGNYTGMRYTTADNDKDYTLAPFLLFNIGLSQELKFGTTNWIVSLDVKNVLNTTYYPVENRPMPLRNFLINIKYTIPYDKS